MIFVCKTEVPFFSRSFYFLGHIWRLYICFLELLLSNLSSTLIIRLVTKLKSLGLASENLVDEDDDDLQNLVDDVDADLESLADDEDDEEEFIEDEDDDLELLDQSDVDFENLFPQIMLLWDFSLTFLDNKR